MNRLLRTKQITLPILILFATLFNCATYTMTTSSLQDQIKDAVPQEGTFTFTTGGLFLFNKVMYNGIRTIVVQDKNGKEKTINVTNRTGIRITKKDGSTKTFYFDTMFIKDDCIIGQKTHFFNWAIKPIPFADIVKIEIQ
jgi:hypothetical protein